MKIMVACEFSGRVRDAFALLGHDAWSCDVIPSEQPGNHIQDDVLKHLDDGWDMMIGHPDCTYLAVSGAKHFKYRLKEQEQALIFVKKLMDANIPRICIENPVSVISTRIRKPTQIIQPWQFGESYQKTTCLWLTNLPKLIPTNIVGKGEFIITPSGRKLPKWYSDNKSKTLRSRTFKGIAQAMAEQWGRLKSPTTG
jgi:hypothetical protein